MPPVSWCLLCRLPCNISVGPQWMLSLQGLAFEQGKLLPPVDPTRPRQSGVIYVHSACWSVVEKQLHPRKVDGAVVERFTLFLESLAPHLKFVQFFLDPTNVEPHLGEDLPFDPDPDNRRPVSQSPGAPPADIIHCMYAVLDDYQDVENMHIATQVPPGHGVWLRIGRRFLILSQYNSGTNKQNATKIRRALRRLRHHPNLFPRALNYEILYSNIELVLGRMDAVQHGSNAAMFFTSRFRLTSPCSPILAKKITPRLGELTALRLEFSNVGGKAYLCGLTICRSVTGYMGDFSVTVQHGKICGLRLMSSGTGFEGVQVKRQTGWGNRWHGRSPPSQLGLATYTELVWKPEGDGQILVALDTCKICDISYVDSASDLPYFLPSWRSSSPPEQLTPAFLYYSKLAQRLEPPISVFDGGLRQVSALHGCINPKSGYLSCLELQFRGVVNGRLGSPRTPFCKLSFELERGETISEVAYPVDKMKPFAFKFITNRNRSVVIGFLGNTHWRVIPAPDGILYKFSRIAGPRGRGLDFFGIFFDDRIMNTSPRQVITQDGQGSHWRMRVLSFTKWFSNRNMFNTEADVSSINKVAVHKDEGQIYGLTVFSTNLSMPRQILGYPDRRRAHTTVHSEHAPDSEEFEIQGQLVSVCVHYSTVYEVIGLYFATTTGQRIEIGNVRSFPQQYLRFSEFQRTLYWLFDDEMDYLTLSDSHRVTAQAYRAT